MAEFRPYIKVTLLRVLGVLVAFGLCALSIGSSMASSVKPGRPSVSALSPLESPEPGTSMISTLGPYENGPWSTLSLWPWSSFRLSLSAVGSLLI